jgi:cell pole-organizing protein PopZ
MEEILASIRRIIAEGEREAHDPGSPPERNEPGASSKPPTSDTAGETGQAGVLVLTEMVQDDGSVVSLPSTPTTSAPAQPEAPPALPEASAPPDDAAVDNLLRKTLLGETAPSAAASISFTTTVETAAVSVEPKAAPTPPPAPAAKPSAPVETAVKPKPADAVPDKPPAWLSPTPPPPPKEERTPVSSEGLKKPELVSEEALAASTAALAQLAQSVTRTREPAPGASKTVDEVVREAVEPMLKQWLDQHLPRIVERMVREAIDRVVRRVE